VIFILFCRVWGGSAVVVPKSTYDPPSRSSQQYLPFRPLYAQGSSNVGYVGWCAEGHFGRCAPFLCLGAGPQEHGIQSAEEHLKHQISLEASRDLREASGSPTKQWI
jgi:hypothetical protein